MPRAIVAGIMKFEVHHVEQLLSTMDGKIRPFFIV